MLTVLLGLGSALGYVAHDFLMVKVVRAVPVWSAMAWSMGTAALLLTPLALLLHGLPNGSAEWAAAGWAVAGGLCEAAALACLLRGLVTGNLSIVTPLASLAGGIVALIAVAGGETLTATAMMGLPLAVAGGLLASIEKAPAEEVFRLDDRPAAEADQPARAPARRRGTAGAGWALFSSVLFAVVILLLDRATALPPVSVAAWGRFGTMVVLVPVALLLGGLSIPREFRRRCALAGMGDAAGFILFTGAIALGPLAVASVVISQGGTMAVLVGYVALRERLSRIQYVGVACTIAACTLFAVG